MGSARSEPLRFIVIGAGNRGHAYAGPISETDGAVIHAVAEPAAYRRRVFGARYIWGSSGESARDGQEFHDWRAWLAWEQDRRDRKARGHIVPPGVDGVLVCTLDDTHVDIVLAIAHLDLHILCEKPLAANLDDSLSIAAAFREQSTRKIFSIGHVLRYSPHNLLLRKLLLQDRVIGDILSIEHTEPVGWQHFAHSYTRGDWRRQTDQRDGSLLTKCCHDLDFLLWILAQPYSRTKGDRGTQMPRIISSTGSVNQFRRSRKPQAAGDATNCTSCGYERDCQFSAVRIYDDNMLAQGGHHWLKKVVHDIEDVLRDSGYATARESLHAALAQDYDSKLTPPEQIAARPWYGRCVYECDNDVCDDQVVTITWDEEEIGNERLLGKTAILHMIANTERECERRGVVYGTRGELSYDSRVIRYFDFLSQKTTVVDASELPTFVKELNSHGGGDRGLARAFIAAVDAVENLGVSAPDAQAQFVGCTLEDAVIAHATGFAAEEARRKETVIRWRDWWESKLQA